MNKVAVAVDLHMLSAALPAAPVVPVLAPDVNMEPRHTGGSHTPPGFPISLSVLRI